MHSITRQKPQSSWPLYSNGLIGTLTVNGWVGCYICSAQFSLRFTKYNSPVSTYPSFALRFSWVPKGLKGRRQQLSSSSHACHMEWHIYWPFMCFQFHHFAKPRNQRIILIYEQGNNSHCVIILVASLYADPYEYDKHASWQWSQIVKNDISL